MTYVALRRLWSHMMCHHKGLVPTMCGVCYRAMADTGALRAHVDKEHPGATARELACRVCAKQYSSVYKVLERLRTKLAFYVSVSAASDSNMGNSCTLLDLT